VGELALYFDRCCGRRFPEMVEQMKPPFKVESHYKPKLRDDTPDDEWLLLLAKMDGQSSATTAVSIKNHRL
jgi:hypothetical protein